MAWKLFTKGLAPTEAHARLQLTGDERLGLAAPQPVAVLAEHVFRELKRTSC